VGYTQYNEKDLAYALLCQAMFTDLWPLLDKLGETLKLGNLDDAYMAAGAYIGRVKLLEDKFKHLKPSKIMLRLQHKSFSALLEAHHRLSWLLYSCEITNLALHPKALNLALDDINKAVSRVSCSPLLATKKATGEQTTN